MGPQEWIDGGTFFNTLGTTSVSGTKVLANTRPVFGTLTIGIFNVGFNDTDISQPKIMMLKDMFIEVYRVY